MVFYFILIKPLPETEAQRIIRYADIMILNSDYTGKIDRDCLDITGAYTKTILSTPLAAIRSELHNMQPANLIHEGKTVSVDITKEYIQKNYDDMRTHLLTYGYITLPQTVHEDWILNDVGKKMKTLKGHYKYQEYIEDILKAEISENKGKIYWKKRVAIAAVISLIVGGILTLLGESILKQLTNRPSSEKSNSSLPAKTSAKK